MKKVSSLKDIGKLFDGGSPEAPGDDGQSHEIAALMMYLTGAEERHFGHVKQVAGLYEHYSRDEDATVVRNLCMLRTALVRNHRAVENEMLYGMKSLAEVPEYVPESCVRDLEKAGISFRNDRRPDVCAFIMQINREIPERINRVRPLFPDWVRWDYVRPLFIMPGGSDRDGVRKAEGKYNSGRDRYPYRVWINWEADGCGNLFLNDRKFLSLLYESRGDAFRGGSLARGTDRDMLTDLYGFIGAHRRTLLVVDCENSDPVKLAAALLSLTDAQAESVGRISFFDSANTTPAWETLCGAGIAARFETERKVVSTLYDYKSQVDMQLAVDVTKAACTEGFDAVILASSDSDYWTLIRSLPDTDFLVLLEKAKSGNTIREALDGEGCPYCFIDDFCTSRAYAVKTETIRRSVQKRLDGMVSFNLREMIEDEARKDWLSLTKKEADNLFSLYMNSIHLKMEKDGTARLVVKG